MKNFVIINGVNSNTINGLGINELPPISKPSMRVQQEVIDGRDGDITTNLGYSAYDKTITIGLFGTGYDINDIISFFNGEGTIVFSNEDDKYYKYKIINQIDYEALQKFKQASITFHCQPFKYPLNETPLEIEYEYIEQDGVESATMNNTNGGTSLKIDLKGNTSQYTTTGYALYDFMNNTYTKEGNLTVTKLDNGYTITNNDTIEARIIFNGVSVDSSKNYVISFDLINASGSRVRVGWVGSSKIIATYSTSGKQAQSFTGITTSAFSIYVETGKTITITNLMIYEGTDLTKEYEPYTGNQPSPSPDFPQQIHEVSGDNTIEVVGKNITNVDTYVQGFINASGGYGSTGVSSFTIQNGTIAITTTMSNRGAVSDYIEIKPNTNYIFSFTKVGTMETYTRFAWYDENKSSISRIQQNTYLTSPSNAKYVRIVVELAEAGTLSIKDLQLEQNTSSTTYEPYNVDTYELSLGDIKMRGIGTYEDYFVRNSGKNLFDVSTFENQLVTGKIIDDNGNEVSDTTSEYSTYKIFLKANETIHIEGWFQRVYYYDENGIFKSRSASGGTSKMSSTYTPTTNEYIAFQIRTDVYPQNKGREVINKGNATLPMYEPYGTGQWCKYNAIGEYILTGEETIVTTSSTSTRTYYGIDYSTNGIYQYSLATDMPIFLCEKFTPRMQSGSFLPNQVALQTSNKYVIYIFEPNTTEIQAKEILTGMKSYYAFAQPYLSLIEDETLKSQLDNIQNAMSYEGQTNVSQVNNDKPFLLDLIAMKKGTDEVVINNIGNVYAKPTIALEGTGETDIYLNNTEILKVDLSEKNKITIDTNNMEAYDPTDNSLANRKVIGNYNSMTLPSGNTTMKITGALTKATITDYSRWL